MKNLRKIALVLLLLMCTTLLACGKKAPSPTDVVNDEFKKIQGADMGTLEMLSLTAAMQSGDTGLSKETATKFIEKFKNITFKVNSEKISGDTATVNMTVKGLDLDILLEDVLAEALDHVMAVAFSGEEMTEEETNAYIESLVIKHLDTISYSERTADLTLVKVNDTWEIKDDSTLAILLLGMDDF